MMAPGHRDLSHGSLPVSVSLDGDWDFTYTPDRPEGPPPPDQFSVVMPVPGYWDDHTDRMQGASFWGRDVARFKPEFRSISFPMGTNRIQPQRGSWRSRSALFARLRP